MNKFCLENRNIFSVIPIIMETYQKNYVQFLIDVLSGIKQNKKYIENITIVPDCDYIITSLNFIKDVKKFIVVPSTKEINQHTHCIKISFEMIYNSNDIFNVFCLENINDNTNNSLRIELKQIDKISYDKIPSQIYEQHHFDTQIGFTRKKEMLATIKKITDFIEIQKEIQVLELDRYFAEWQQYVKEHIKTNIDHEHPFYVDRDNGKNLPREGYNIRVVAMLNTISLENFIEIFRTLSHITCCLHIYEYNRDSFSYVSNQWIYNMNGKYFYVQHTNDNNPRTGLHVTYVINEYDNLDQLSLCEQLDGLYKLYIKQYSPEVNSINYYNVLSLSKWRSYIQKN